MQFKVVLAAVAVVASTSGAFAGSHTGVVAGEWVCTGVTGPGSTGTCSTYNAPNQPRKLINTTIQYVKGTNKLAGKQGIPQAPLPRK